MKYHGKLHFLYKLYFNKILSLSFILFSFVSSNIKNFVVTLWVSLCVLLYSVNNPYNFFQPTTLKIIDLAVYVWYVLCVCVCACVRVFILFHLLVSSGCKTSVTYVRSSCQRSFVVNITRGFCQVPSSLFSSR